MNRKNFCYHLRGLRSRAHDAQDNTILMKRFRVAAASYIKTAKSLYEMSIREELEELNTFRRME
eukprot:9182714-Pyramimonas_sp.AAC.1